MRYRVMYVVLICMGVFFVTCGCGCSKGSEFIGTWENDDNDVIEINRDGTIDEYTSDGKHYEYKYEIDDYPTINGKKYSLTVIDITGLKILTSYHYDEENDSIFYGYSYSPENSYKKK